MLKDPDINCLNHSSKGGWFLKLMRSHSICPHEELIRIEHLVMEEPDNPDLSIHWTNLD